MTDLEIAILKALYEAVGPSGLLGIIAKKHGRDEALALLDSEYEAVEKAARLLEVQKFGG